MKRCSFPCSGGGRAVASACEAQVPAAFGWHRRQQSPLEAPFDGLRGPKTGLHLRGVLLPRPSALRAAAENKHVDTYDIHHMKMQGIIMQLIYIYICKIYAK